MVPPQICFKVRALQLYDLGWIDNWLLRILRALEIYKADAALALAFQILEVGLCQVLAIRKLGDETHGFDLLLFTFGSREVSECLAYKRANLHIIVICVELIEDARIRYIVSKPDDVLYQLMMGAKHYQVVICCSQLRSYIDHKAYLGSNPEHCVYLDELAEVYHPLQFNHNVERSF